MTNRTAALADRFDRLLAAWLAWLPGNWEGTPRQLANELETFSESGRFFALVPHSGLLTLLDQHEPTILRTGWRVAYRRTAAARLITFRKATN